MNQKNNDETVTEGLVCNLDPKYTAELLVRSHEGLLSEEQEADLKDHLKKCEWCRAEYESLSELDFEMLLAANDDDQLRKFSPDFQHAEKCLLTTWQRLERFAEGRLEQEFIGDEELKKHIDECVYCRRRSIITHRKIKYKNHLPLAYSLVEEAVQEAMNVAGSTVWNTTSQKESETLLKMAAQDTIQGGAAAVVSRTLRSGDNLEITIRGGFVRLQFPHTQEWSGKSIALISQDGREFCTKLSDDALGLLADVPPGEYQILIDKDQRCIIQLYENATEVSECIPSTYQSLVEAIQSPESERGKTATQLLISKYWKPIYCYLRRKGYGNEPAKDLTQGFFHEIVLGKDIVQQADEAKGRFRTFLLTALNHYITSVHRANVAGKRHPKDGVVSLEEFDEESMSFAAKDMKPEDVFTYVWASVLMDDVLAEVKKCCIQDGKRIHWEVFYARVIKPMHENVGPPTLKEICSKYGVDSKAKASNMIITVKRRFRKVMRRQLGQFVESDSEVGKEFNEILRILSKNSPESERI